MITYDYYRIFYYVAQYKSFTRAAEALHNNQPNITTAATVYCQFWGRIGKLS